MSSIRGFTKALIPDKVFSFFQPAYHLFLAWLASLLYGFPSKHLRVIGVTGTNGKTTVVHLLHEIFEAAGHKAGSASSLRFKIGEAEESNLLKMTMPGRFYLQKFLSRCRGAGCRVVILEVTSEGIKQSRHRFINFHSAVLTNVRPEHIEAHGGFEDYREAKLELFRRLPPRGFAVLNREDASSPLFAGGTKAEVVWYSQSAIDLGRTGHPVRVLGIEPERLQFEMGDIFMETNLGGMFNLMNVLAALSAALAFDIPLTSVARALKGFGGVAGRMEFIQEKPFSVVVDYAHTPDALESVYQTLSSANPKSARPRRAEGETGEIRNPKLICVLGSAGGGRDKWKRPEMGKVASRYCQQIILTSEDPDDENPSQIASEMRSGIPNNQETITKTVLDRREAIREALKTAKPGDTVIITGMGAQPWFIEKGKKIPWDDREVVREELVRIKNQELRIKVEVDGS